MNIYGVLDSHGCHIDISTSLKGTKRVATLQGYKYVSVRNSNYYYVDILFEKINGKWVVYQAN